MSSPNRIDARLHRLVHHDRVPHPAGLAGPLVGGIQPHLGAEAGHRAGEVPVVDGVLSTSVVSRVAVSIVHAVVRAQMTSFQSRMFQQVTSSSTHDDELGVHELAQEAPDPEHHPLGVARVLLLDADHRQPVGQPSGGR